LDLAKLAMAVLAGTPGRPILVFDEAGVCVASFGDVSDEFAARFGHPSDAVGRGCVELMGTQSADFLALAQQLFGGASELVRSGVFEHPQGRLAFEARFWRVAGQPLIACQSEHLGRVDEFRDALAETQSRFEAFARHSARFVCEIDPAGVITYVGAKSLELGIPPKDFVGIPMKEVVSRMLASDPAAVGIAHHAIDRFIASQGALDTYRANLVDASGRTRSLVSSGEWYTTASGERRGFLLYQDEAAPETSAASTARARALSSLAGSLVDAVLEVTLDGVIVAATPLPATWEGAGSSLEGRSVFDHLHPGDVERARSVLAKASQAPSLEPTLYRWRAAGEGWRFVEARTVVYSPEGGSARLIAVIRDATDELTHAGDLPAEEGDPSQYSLSEGNLAVLAGGIAHDFNNLLTVSLGVTDLIAEQFPPDSPVRSQLGEVVTASRHAADLARQLLAITGRRALDFAPCDVNQVIGGVAALLRSAVPRSVRVEFTPTETPLWIDGDATQIRQVLLNLVSNAGEAIGPRTGSISIQTSRVCADTDLGPTNFAVIEVRDDGPGMDEDTRRRVFEPAFTTKTTGHGLGLAVVRSVITRHQGRILVEANPTGGTVFRIGLPLLPDGVAEAERRMREAITLAPRTGGGTVLMVDDDDAVRRVSAAMLRLANFTVLEAGDAATMRAVVASGVKLDCAIVDLVMPDADGLALIEELRGAQPNLEVVVCSGAVDRLPEDRVDLVVLEKPFRYAQLIEVVWRCVERGQSAAPGATRRAPEDRSSYDS
jgi:signal transduction histidine kinase/CheY-like chemotaxis protein